MGVEINQTNGEKVIQMALDKVSAKSNQTKAMTGLTPIIIEMDAGSYIDGVFTTGASHYFTVGQAGTARVRFSGSCSYSGGGNNGIIFEIYKDTGGGDTATGITIERDFTSARYGSFCLEADLVVASGDKLSIYMNLTNAGTQDTIFQGVQFSLEWVSLS